MKTIYHRPVMLNEAIQGLNINPNGVYVDVTFGGGGHSRAILQKLSESGRLMAFDQDLEVLQNEIIDDRFQLIRGKFSHFNQYLKFPGISTVDGFFAGFGVFSH